MPLLAGSLIGGPLVDAWDRGWVMLFTQFTLVVGPAAAGLLIAHAGFPLVYGLDLASFGVALAAAGAADVMSAVFRMMIVQQVTPDGMQGRVNSLIYAGIQGGPRLGDAEAGGAAALGGPQFAA